MIGVNHINSLGRGGDFAQRTEEWGGRGGGSYGIAKLTEFPNWGRREKGREGFRTEDAEDAEGADGGREAGGFLVRNSSASLQYLFGPLCEISESKWVRTGV